MPREAHEGRGDGRAVVTARELVVDELLQRRAEFGLVHGTGFGVRRPAFRLVRDREERRAPRSRRHGPREVRVLRRGLREEGSRRGKRGGAGQEFPLDIYIELFFWIRP